MLVSGRVFAPTYDTYNWFSGAHLLGSGYDRYLGRYLYQKLSMSVHHWTRIKPLKNPCQLDGPFLKKSWPNIWSKVAILGMGDLPPLIEILIMGI